jgi:hypothetical protein
MPAAAPRAQRATVAWDDDDFHPLRNLAALRERIAAADYLGYVAAAPTPGREARKP